MYRRVNSQEELDNLTVDEINNLRVLIDMYRSLLGQVHIIKNYISMVYCQELNKIL